MYFVKQNRLVLGEPNVYH